MNGTQRPPAMLVFCALCLLPASVASAQAAALPDLPASAPAEAVLAEPEAGSSSASEPSAVAALDGGAFRGIRLGMGIDEVKAALRKESLFDYRGDRDVSMVPQTEQVVIEVEGRIFVERGYFQFHDGKLLIMIVALAREEVSYYEVYTQLTSRYGEASSLDPRAARWDLPGVRLSVEKPVVLKYVDSEAFDALKKSSGAGRDYEAETRRQFLDEL